MRGPLAAVIATLLDLGWQAPRPYQWISPGGRSWTIDPQAPGVWEDLRQELLRYMTRDAWLQAAQHYLGGGREAGIDVQASRRGWPKPQACSLYTIDASQHAQAVQLGGGGVGV